MSNPADGSERAKSGPEALVGVVLSERYLIERLIGEGGMGAVYQAEHTHMRKRMAVKVLHPEMSRLPEVVARFEREALASAHIDHPNVAAATDFGKLADGSFFLVLEYVEGKSLREALAQGHLELGRAIHIARQTASALARAHALGIVHRDLKPENVMLVSRDGDPDFVKVLDFGIAKVPVGELVGEPKVPGQALTQLGMVYGTPEYMAPEQALGQTVDPRADLYALGVMMFEMIVGARPYDHESKVTLLGMHVTAPVPSMAQRAPEANVPLEIDALVQRLLAKEAAARFAGAKELVDALDAAVVRLADQGRIAELVPPRSIPRMSAASSPDRSGPNLAMGVGPTSLAHPGTRAAARGRSLLDGARASIRRTLEGAPPWLSPRVAALGAGSIAVVLVLALVSLIGSGSRARPAGAGAAAASGDKPTGPVYPPDPKIDQVLADARANVERGNFATAIDDLTPLEKRPPQRADVHAVLEHAYVGAHDVRRALEEAALWLELDPTAAADLKLEEDVRNAALVRDTQEDAFALLESKMGTDGVDLLYEIAYGASGKLYPLAAARAKHSLELPEVREHAGPALRVLLEMHDAKTCEEKRGLLGEARDHGDARLVPVLRSLESARGCGFLGHADCHPCLHRDHALGEAIRAIEERGAAAK